MSAGRRFTAARFWARVDMTADFDCWPWMGAHTEKGYGRVLGPDGRLWRAHRLAWDLTNGPVPDDLWVLHSCDNPPCVRPDHLWLGTHTDNLRDAARKGRLGRRLATRTSCKRGHPFTPENTYHFPNRPGRRCRTCHRLWVEQRKVA